MKYMYHLTTEESWEHIREEGLRPRCGRNSYLFPGDSLGDRTR